MASQIKAKQAPPQFSCLNLLHQEFKTKLKAFEEAQSSDEEAGSSDEEARSSKAVARTSEMESRSNAEEKAASLDVFNFDGVTANDDVLPILYIHVNCTSHNDQTDLRVSIEKVYGSGGRDKRNVCQLSFQVAILELR
jgi:hypothetical protein